MKTIRRFWPILLASATLGGVFLSLRATAAAPDDRERASSQQHGASSETGWPMWRYDAFRSSATSTELADDLQLHWSRDLPSPRPAFPPHVRPRLCFDRTYRPVAADGLLFVPSMVTDSVTAYDLSTGDERWRFFADAPVRLAPVVWHDRIYFVCDDGYLYCLDARTGRELWRVTPLPETHHGQLLPGDERLISRWPARGGPLIHEGVLYYALGYLAFEGVFVCAVDPVSGEFRWVSDAPSIVPDGLVDHGARRPGGLSPQGYLAVVRDRLVVPGGRSLPGFFDLQTGEMEPHTTGWGGREALAKGVWYTSAVGEYFFHGGDMFTISPALAPRPLDGNAELLSPERFAEMASVSVAQVQEWIDEEDLVTTERDGRVLIDPLDQRQSDYVGWGQEPATAGERHTLQAHPRVQIDPANYRELGVFREPVLSAGVMYYSRPTDHRLVGEARGGHLPEHVEYAEIFAYDISDSRPGYTLTTYSRSILWPAMRFRELWRLESDLNVQMKAGQRLYGGARGAVGAIDIPEAGGEPTESWRVEIQGTPGTMLACDGRLITVTEEGRIYCFGAGDTEAQHHETPDVAMPSGDERWSADVERMLRGKPDQGYCVVIGSGGYEAVDELLRQSELQVIVLDAREATADEARRRYDGRGVYGSRVHIVPASVDSLTLSPYFASLVVCADAAEADLLLNPGAIETVSRWLRPYGGSAWIATTAGEHRILTGLADEADLDGVELRRRGDFTVIRQPGALPASSGWTHESGSAANTFASDDLRVRPPLGVLWFGGSVDEIFPPWDYTHKRGPLPVIAHGRMFVLVANELHAVDVFTGQLLWSAELEETGKAMRRQRHHMRKQRAWAENFVATPDMLYVVGNGTCVQISAESGRRLGELAAPEDPGEDAFWREVYVSDDRLVGTAADQLICLDRHTGEEKWRIPSGQDTFHLAIGESTVFCVDYWLPDRLRRGDVRTEPSTITALDLSSGQVRWEHRLDYPINPAEEMTGEGSAPLEPYLQYCAAQDVLLLTLNRSQSVSYGIIYGDRPATVAGFRGDDGEQLWAGHVPCRDVYSKYSGPELPIVLPDRFITHAGQVHDLTTGLEIAERLWEGMNCNYNTGGLRGCNRAVANAYMVTARDSIATYIDVQTGLQDFFRGMRSGCTNSLLPAEGVLSSPNLSHGCACNTPIFVSCAFAHMPDAALWDEALSRSYRHPGMEAEIP